MNQSRDDPAKKSSPAARAGLEAGTRADLIAAGRKLFARRGFDGTSIRAITREASANLGAVTYHFRSKRALYAAVLEAGLRPLAARVGEAAAGEGSGLERMIGVADAYFDHFQRHPDIPRLLLQEVAAGKKPPAIVVEIISEVKEILVGLHAQGSADGSVRPGHPLLSALSVVSQPIYLALAAPMLRSVGGLDLADPTTRAVTVAHIRDFVRAGLEPHPDAPSGSTETT